MKHKGLSRQTYSSSVMVSCASVVYWLLPPCSASRVAGEISALGRLRIRPCGLTAASRPDPRFARLTSTSLPGRSDGLRFGLFWPEAKTIPPLHPSPASGRGVCLLVSGKPTFKHTHMSAEAYPPDGPQISPPQGSQNFSVGAAAMERAVKCSMTRLREAMCPENFCARQAGGCAVPDPGRFGNQTYGHATTLPWWFPEHLETPT